MQVVILCGGQGTRAYPTTRRIPKALMPVADVPIVEQVMRIYASQGYREFILAVGYLKEAIEEYFRDHPGPWDVTCVDTGAETDTGGRIERLRPLLRGTFHATYCDGLSDLDLRALVAFHQERGALATLTAAPLRSQYGILTPDGDDRIAGFEEKPVLPDYRINGGFFVFEREALDEWKGQNLERDVLPHLAGIGALYMYRHDGFWRSMDTYKDQQELNALWEPHAQRLKAALSLNGRRAELPVR